MDERPRKIRDERDGILLARSVPKNSMNIHGAVELRKFLQIPNTRFRCRQRGRISSGKPTSESDLKIRILRVYGRPPNANNLRPHSAA